MPTLIAGAVAVIVIYLLLQMFRAANPTVLARALKISGGVVALAVAAFTGFRGELAVAIPLGIFGAGLLGWSPFGVQGFGNIGGIFGGAGAQRSAGQSSRVRSQFLDMTLDHDSGELDGQIVAGPHAGRSLNQFDLSQLTAMIPGFDAESVALLESYLDRRFPAWRQDAQGNAAGGQRRPANTKMTDEEAYQILGLQPGAGRDEIGRAHRALMKKLHPDQGGSTYLAARVNEAKDTLLRTHNG
jgi:DnaJ-domain-containing protein 1